jgi:ribosomal protein S18 acetylase RimI-like enzyme
MKLSCLNKDKQEIEELLGGNPYLHMYSIGDLDERFQPYTQWHGLKKSGKLLAVICIYTSTDTPTVMALAEDGDENITELLENTIQFLPDFFQAHLSPGLEKLFADSHCTELNASHYKMSLLDRGLIESVNADEVVRLDSDDIPMLLELYSESYPGNWFEPEMLELNRYFGIKEGGRLLSAAGTHVYSPSYKAAAIGNITTHPEFRGLGLGAKVTAGLGRMLLSEGMRVGLNVKMSNPAAVTCYRNVGFSICAEFGEYIFRRK